MAEFITKCPHCNAELQAQDEWIGMELECLLCHKMFAINRSSAQVETEKTEAVTNSALAADEKNCPFCNGIIKEQAIFCKHCKQKINPIEPPEPPVQETCGEGGSLSFCELLGSTWNILCCRPGVAIGFTALLVFIYLSIDICQFIIISLAQGNNTAISSISLIFLLLGIFIQPVFLLWILLNALLLRRNQEINPQSIFLYVKQNQWMHFLWGFWRPAIFIFLWSLLLIVPGLIAGMKYIMTLFILLDNPELSVKEAMKHSAEITMGHKLKIFGAFFVVALISSGCTVLVQIITQSANIATIVGWGISIILTPFTSLFFAEIYEMIRRS